MTIRNIKKIKTSCTVYDIEVDVDHSFIVNDCVLHNCLVCGALDGKTFDNLNDDKFQLPKHRGCVLGNTLISAVDGISKVYRRRYKGLIYRIRTASGNVLSVTPNHPILTDKGFVRAHLLNIGDNVISDNGLKTVGIISKDKNNRQVLIKDVFRSFRKSPFMFACTVPITAEDFHGDAVYNKVNIVSANRKLGSERNVFGLQNFSEDSFINRNGRIRMEGKPKKCGFFQIFCSHFSAFCRFVGSLCKMCNLFWCGVFHSFSLLFVRISYGNVVSSKKTNHLCSSEVEPLNNSCNADSLIVKFKNFINAKIISRVPPSSADIGSMENISDDVFGNTELAGNILDGYSTQIKTDSIVAIDIIKKKFCHVYNLETKNNWYVANGIITHNCRCMIIPHFDIEGDTRASKDGQVDSKLTFNDWLKEQDEKTQLDVLGRTRYELFRRGEPITQFVDNGKTLTLDELKNRIDIQAILNQNIKEPDINNLSLHFKERLKERNVSIDDIEDSIKNPVIRYPVRTDGTYKIIGKYVTIGVSASTGRIVTVWKTGHKTIERLLKEVKK